MGNLLRSPRNPAGLEFIPIPENRLLLSNSPGDTANDIQISIGETWIVDSLGRRQLATLGSAITKRLDASWSAGDNSGGLASGTKAANTTYHVHLLLNESTKVCDVCFSTSLIANDRPSGWAAKLIGSILTDSSGNIRQFVQSGNWFWWPVGINNSTGALPTTLSSLSLTVPSGLVLEVDLIVRADTNGIMLMTPGRTSLAAYFFPTERESLRLNTNSSAQISVLALDSSAVVITTQGFRHPRMLAP